MSDFFSFVGAADAYVDILTETGASTGLSLEGDCSEFTPKPDADRKEQTAHGRDNYGQTLASVTLPKPMTATIKFGQLSQSLFAAAFFGTNSNFSQAAESGKTASVTAIADKFVEIGAHMISNLEVKDETDATTYTEGIDYTCNVRLGMIQALSSGGIADGDVLHLTFDQQAIAGTQMAAMTKANVLVAVKLDGKNFADGRDFISEIYMMRLAPTSNFSLIGEEFVEATFEGTLETPAGKLSPMRHIWLS